MSAAELCEKVGHVSSDQAGVSALGDELLVFLHLHKTGGTSLLSLIKQLLPSAKFAPTDRSGNVDLRYLEDPQTKVVAGHITAYDLSSSKRSKAVVTVLREPIERLLSHIYFIKSYTKDHLSSFNRPELNEMKEKPISELIYSNDFYQRFSNYYIKRLDPEFDHLACSADGREPSFERALNFVKLCRVVGTTNHMVDFARDLLRLTNTRKNIILPTENARSTMQKLSGFERPTTEPIQARDLEYLETILSLDRKLYNYILFNPVR